MHSKCYHQSNLRTEKRNKSTIVELSPEELHMVSGGYGTLIVGGFGGAAVGAAAAHANGDNVLSGAAVGFLSGLTGGAGSLLYNTSKVAGVSLMGVGFTIMGSYAYSRTGGSRIKQKPKQATQE